MDLAGSTGLVADPQDLLRSIDERERLCSTALAGGIALLHPRNHEPYMFDDSFVVLGDERSSRFHFGSPDGAMTDLFFLICCQDDRIHLHALTRLCMMCHYSSVLLELRDAEGCGFDVRHDGQVRAGNHPAVVGGGLRPLTGLWEPPAVSDRESASGCRRYRSAISDSSPSRAESHRNGSGRTRSASAKRTGCSAPAGPCRSCRRVAPVRRPSSNTHCRAGPCGGRRSRRIAIGPCG